MHPNSQKNYKSTNFQSEQTYGLLQVVINRTGREQAQNKFNRESKGLKVDKQNI